MNKPKNVRQYKTQLDAVAYLNNVGFKVSKSQFSRDFKAKKVPTNSDGCFEESALMGYAAVYLTATELVSDKAMGTATTERLSADAELKRIQAARALLKLEKEQGLLMSKVDHERELAARALFFAAEIRNFIKLHGAGIIHLVGGEEDKLPLLFSFWKESTSNWMDIWAEERQFAVTDGFEEDSHESF